MYVIIEIASCLYIIPVESFVYGDNLLFHGTLAECESMIVIFTPSVPRPMSSADRADIESAILHPYG